MIGKIKQYITGKRQKEYYDNPKGAFYMKIEALVSTRIKYTDTPRRQEVQIFRLRLGAYSRIPPLSVLHKYSYTYSHRHWLSLYYRFVLFCLAELFGYLY